MANNGLPGHAAERPFNPQQQTFLGVSPFVWF